MTRTASRPVTVVGIGGDGQAGLGPRAAGAVRAARLLAGGERHLGYFPDFGGERLVIGSGSGTGARLGVDAALARIGHWSADGPVCVLASGDPLFFGIGARLVDALGMDRVELIPQPSSVQWAFAKVGLSWEDAALLSLHARPATGLLARLRRRSKAALLTDSANSPPAVARHLVAHGEMGWSAWVCERLGEPDERVRPFRVAALAEAEDVTSPNVLLLARDPGWRPPPVVPFLPESAFAARNGLITKREVRALAVASLALREGSVVWDVGAGSGSVAIEAGLLACEGRVFAVERDAATAELCARNLRTHRADNVQLLVGRAPEALRGLPAPDAVFVGGSGGELEAVLSTAWEALRPGGRIAVSAATLETLETARRVLSAQGYSPEVTLASFARGVPVVREGVGGAGPMRLEALNPIHLVAAGKPEGNPEEGNSMERAARRSA